LRLGFIDPVIKFFKRLLGFSKKNENDTLLILYIRTLSNDKIV